MDIPKYISLQTLDRLPEILAVKEAVATEKLHGSNFRIFFPAGMKSLDEVRFGGRNEVFDAGSDGFYGGRPVRWFRDRPELLGKMAETFASRGFSDVTVYGEACGSGIQKGVRYAADGEVFFRAFDIRIGENFTTYDYFVELCEAAGLPRVPEIWRGNPTREAFDALLEQTSTEGARNGVDGPNVSEGVVIRSNPLLRDVFGTWLIIKHKSKQFREVTPAAEKPKVTAAKGPAEVFAETFVNRGRLVNVVGRLKDEGARLGADMKDMPVVTEAVVADLRKECLPEIEALEGVTEKQLRGAVMRVVATTYKAILAEGLVERHPLAGMPSG